MSWFIEFLPSLVGAVLIFAIGMALAWGPWFGLRKLAGDRQSKLAWQIAIWLVALGWAVLASLVVVQMTLETVGGPDFGQDRDLNVIPRLIVTAAVVGTGVVPLLLVLKHEATMHRAVHGVTIVAASLWLTVTGVVALNQLIDLAT